MLCPQNSHIYSETPDVGSGTYVPDPWSRLAKAPTERLLIEWLPWALTGWWTASWSVTDDDGDHMPNNFVSRGSTFSDFHPKDSFELLILPSDGTTGMCYYAWLYSARDQTQGCMHARQVLYQLKYTLSPINPYKNNGHNLLGICYTWSTVLNIWFYFLI